MHVTCPLCLSEHITPHARAHRRPYLSCAECHLIFVPPDFHPDRKTERQRYETHNNDPSDEGYRAFLCRVAAPLIQRVEPPAAGLDYGSGPGPTLSVMLEEHGFDVAIYDPFFAPQPDALNGTYAFVTCTETAEHFHAPRAEFDRLYGLLKPGGWLAVMTQWTDGRDLRRWSYARDETHVCFYCAQTMEWIAEHYGYRLDTPRRDVAFFQKPGIEAAEGSPVRGRSGEGHSVI